MTPIYLAQVPFVRDAYADFESTALDNTSVADLWFIRVNSYINWTASLHKDLVPALTASAEKMDKADVKERLTLRQSARDEIIAAMFGKILETYPEEVEKALRAVLWDFMYAMSHGVSYADQCRLLNTRLMPRVYSWFKHAHPYVHSLFLVDDVPAPEGVKLARMEPSVMNAVCRILLAWVPT